MCSLTTLIIKIFYVDATKNVFIIYFFNMTKALRIDATYFE